MKNLLLVFLTAITFTCSAQDWKKYEFDENLSLELPSDFEVIDTLGQHFVRAFLDNGTLLVQRQPNVGMQASSVLTKQELIKGYGEFAKGIADAHRAVIIKQMNHDVKGIVTSEVTMRSSLRGQQELVHITFVFLNDNWYTVQFWESEEMKNDNAAFIEKLFSSIEFPADATEGNQLSDSGSKAYKTGYAFGYILGFLFLLLIFGVIMYLIFGRRRKKQKEDMT